MEQLSLFSNTVYLSQKARETRLVMDAQSLAKWKSRIFHHQQRIRENKPPQQVNLLDITPSYCEPATIEPFSLHLQSMAFYRMPDDYGQAALYFVLDSTSNLLLYIGETCRSNKRWKSTHDCKDYISSYQDLHHRYEMKVAINISFWFDVPENRLARQDLEQSLIQMWETPFNKENWQIWGQPFGK